MKKILFVITKSNWGGAQRYVYNLATTLSKDQFDVDVALGGTGTTGSAPGELEIRLEKAGVQTFFIPSFLRDVSFISDINAFFELYKLFTKERSDVIHLNSSKAGGVGALAARLAGIKKIVFTSHGLAWDEDRGAIATFLIKLFSWFTFLLCTDVITISKDNLERVQALPFCRNKVSLIHNGLPELTFESKDRARLSMVATTGVPSTEGFWVGTIAELTKNKGLTYLLEASKILLDQGKKFTLFIIGTGEEKQRLETKIEELDLTGVVYLVGFVADAYRYDKAFDIFTLTSVKEGLPTVFIEAGQAGVPVVASDLPGTKDIIENQKTGLLFKTKDVEDLAQKLLSLMDDKEKRDKVAKNLQQKVAEDFSIERMIAETQKLYS